MVVASTAEVAGLVSNVEGALRSEGFSVADSKWSTLAEVPKVGLP